MKSVVIGGGGLAGLALGIALRLREVPVTLHEAASYPRHRVCGEFICGVEPSTLDNLGIADDLSDALRLTYSCWMSDHGSRADFRLPRPALGISRHRLDARLAERFEGLGGQLRTRSRLSTSNHEGMVFCAGRRKGRPKWLGLKMHAAKLALTSELEMHLGKECYVGAAPVENGRVNLCGLFSLETVQEALQRGAGRRDQFLAALRAAGLECFAERLATAELDDASFCSVSALEYRSRPDTRHCSLGDAQGLIPPYTGNGMSLALESAEVALEPLLRWSQERTSWPETVVEIRREHRRRFARRLRVARALHPFLLQRRAQSLVLFLARKRALPFGWMFHLTHG